jgi:transaldolase
MTLIFNFTQGLACAEAGATLISPFVGRILDWFKKAEGRDYKPEEEPGVKSVSYIYNYFKKYGYKTVVMGASFRNSGEIIELAGCDKLTISPQLLDELCKNERKLEKKLDAEEAKKLALIKVGEVTEKVYRWQMNEDAMASEKLGEGIRKFGKDTEECERLIQHKLAKST